MGGPFAQSIGMTIANTNKYSWEHHRTGLVEGAVDGLYGLDNQLRKKLSITLIYFILFFTIFSTRSPRNRSDRTPLTSPSGWASFPTPLSSCPRFLSWLCVSRRRSPLKTTTYCIVFYFIFVTSFAAPNDGGTPPHSTFHHSSTPSQISYPPSVQNFGWLLYLLF